MEQDIASRTVRAFIERINAHDVDGLLRLMTADHAFVDSLGQAFTGTGLMARAWTAYFEWIPDYAVTVERLFAAGDEVVAFGTADGTCWVGGQAVADGSWSVPAAWWAVVRDGRIAHWQVYADNEPVRRVMARAASAQPGPGQTGGVAGLG
jgi:ketosteroid isomerase-like protein